MHFAYDQSLSSSHEPDRETKDEETEVVGDCTLSFPSLSVSNTVHFKQARAKAQCDDTDLCISPWQARRTCYTE